MEFGYLVTKKLKALGVNTMGDLLSRTKEELTGENCMLVEEMDRYLTDEQWENLARLFSESGIPLNSGNNPPMVKMPDTRQPA